MAFESSYLAWDGSSMENRQALSRSECSMRG